MELKAVPVYNWTVVSCQHETGNRESYCSKNLYQIFKKGRILIWKYPSHAHPSRAFICSQPQTHLHTNDTSVQVVLPGSPVCDKKDKRHQLTKTSVLEDWLYSIARIEGFLLNWQQFLLGQIFIAFRSHCGVVLHTRTLLISASTRLKTGCFP